MADEKDKKDAPAPAPAAVDKKGDKPEEKGDHKAEAPKVAANPAGGASPWIPVLVVIFILPILSFVVTDMMIIPRVKKALADVVHIQQESAQPAAGGPLPAERKEAKAEKGKEGEKGADTSVKFENVVANLSGAMKTRFVKVSFTVEGEDPDFKDVVTKEKTKLIDSALGILGGMTVADLDEPGVKNVVRSDLVDAFNQILPKPLIKGLYFSEFVIQ